MIWKGKNNEKFSQIVQKCNISTFDQLQISFLSQCFTDPPAPLYYLGAEEGIRTVEIDPKIKIFWWEMIFGDGY